jgi:Tfp pilus assembly protein PilF
MEKLPALLAMARELLSQDEAALARTVLETCVQRDPGCLQAWLELSNVLYILGEKQASLDASFRAAALAPDEMAAHFNIATVAQQMGLHKVALASREKLLAADSGNANHHFNLAEVLDRLGQFDRALPHYREAATLNPGALDFHIHLGYALLRLGHWHEGWQELSWYWSPQGLGAHSPWALNTARPLLKKGDPIEGKSILVTGWGGTGDLIMFARLMEQLSRRGAKEVALHAFHHAAFFSGNRWAYPAFSHEGASGFFDLLARHDAWVPAAALPAVLGLEPAELASSGAYFSADEKLRADWKARLPAAGARKKIGLAWSGDANNLYEHNRSIATPVLLPLLQQLPEVDWYIVQKNERNAELQAFALPAVFDHSASLNDLRATAALMAELDLVISVDSLPAHLAASLGVPTWLLLSAAADWRWGVAGDTTPWYAGMRLYRQVALGDWAEVLARVAADLRLLPKRV